MNTYVPTMYFYFCVLFRTYTLDIFVLFDKLQTCLPFCNFVHYILCALKSIRNPVLFKKLCSYMPHCSCNIAVSTFTQSYK